MTTSTPTPFPETLASRLRAWEQAIDASARRSIDASTCRTEHDCRRAHEAEARAEEAGEALEEAIRAYADEAAERARRGVNAGTGAEPYLLGWSLRRRRLVRPGMTLGGAVLEGYVACAIAQVLGAPLNDDAAMTVWARTPRES